MRGRSYDAFGNSRSAKQGPTEPLTGAPLWLIREFSSAYRNDVRSADTQMRPTKMYKSRQSFVFEGRDGTLPRDENTGDHAALRPPRVCNRVWRRSARSDDDHAEPRYASTRRLV